MSSYMQQIHNTMQNDLQSVISEHVQFAGVSGTYYVLPNKTPRRGAVLIHGWSGNRFSLGVLARRMATYGIACLSIDLPSHYVNTQDFRLGLLANNIRSSISWMHHRVAGRPVSVVGQSMGSVGALFALCGYSTIVEEALAQMWSSIHRQLERGKHHPEAALVALAQSYDQIKQLLFRSLSKGVKNHEFPSSCVLFVPPKNIQNVYPFLQPLAKFSWLRRAIEKVMHSERPMHLPSDTRSSRSVDGNDVAKQIYFLTDDFKDFVRYFTQAKNPIDLLDLLVGLSSLYHKDDKVSFFDYYLRSKVYGVPKLFVYGSRDLELRMRLPWKRSVYKRFAERWGNAQFMMLDNDHNFRSSNPEKYGLEDQKHVSGFLKDDIAAIEVIKFIDH